MSVLLDGFARCMLRYSPLLVSRGGVQLPVEHGNHRLGPICGAAVVPLAPVLRSFVPLCDPWPRESSTVIEGPAVPMISNSISMHGIRLWLHEPLIALEVNKLRPG